MPRYIYPLHDDARSGVLRHLVASARLARRKRMRLRFPASAPGEPIARDDQCRRHAAAMLERMLIALSRDNVDCSRFFERLITQVQMASNVIAAVMTSIRVKTMSGVQARIIATLIADFVYFVEQAVTEGERIRVYLAIAVDDDRLIVAFAAEGAVKAVSTASASAALMRAGSIVRLLDGDFQRGVDGERHIFGLTFPPRICGWE